MATSVAQTDTDEGLYQSVRGENLARAADTLTAVGLGPDAVGDYDEAALRAYVDERGWAVWLEAKGGGWYAELAAEISPEENWYGIAGDIERVPALALALAALLRAPWPEQEGARPRDVT